MAAHIELITIAIAGVSGIPAALEVLRRRQESASSDVTGTSDENEVPGVAASV